MGSGRVIAIEEHFETAETAGYASGVFASSTGEPPAVPASVREQLRARLQDPDVRISTMDAGGIDYAVVSQTSPGVQAEPDPVRARSVAARANDALRSMIDAHPDRLGGFAHLPMHDALAASCELRRAVDELGLCGALVNGPTLGRYLDDEHYAPFWECVEQLGVPVYLHPAPAPPAHTARFAPYELLLSGAMWGWGCDTATQALRLTLAGVFDRHPGVQIILGHMGELLPFTLSRLDSRYEVARRQDPRAPRSRISHYLRNNFLVSTSGVLSDAALRCTISELGIERVLFSTDYPYEDEAAAVRFLREARLSDEERRHIASVNAETWLRIPSGLGAMPDVGHNDQGEQSG